MIHECYNKSEIYFQIETKLTGVVRTTDITKDERDEQTCITRRLEDERRRRGGVGVVLMEFMYLISRFFLVVGLIWLLAFLNYSFSYSAHSICLRNKVLDMQIHLVGT